MAFRVLAAGNEPEFRTIADFRKRHLAALQGFFEQVLRLARELGAPRVGRVAIDGSKLGFFLTHRVSPILAGFLIRNPRKSRRDDADRMGKSTQPNRKSGDREDLDDISDRGVKRGIKPERAATTETTGNVTFVNQLDERQVHIEDRRTRVHVRVSIRIRIECH